MNTKKADLLVFNCEYVFCADDYYCHCMPCGKERYSRDMIKWRNSMAHARATENYREMDRLDIEYEKCGLP